MFTINLPDRIIVRFFPAILWGAQGSRAEEILLAACKTLASKKKKTEGANFITDTPGDSVALHIALEGALSNRRGKTEISACTGAPEGC